MTTAIITSISDAIYKAKFECAETLYDYIVANVDLINYLYTHQYLYDQNRSLLKDLPFSGGGEHISIYYKTHETSSTNLAVALPRFVERTVENQAVTPETYSLLFNRLKESFAIVRDYMVQDNSIDQYRSLINTIKTHQGLADVQEYDFGDD